MKRWISLAIIATAAGIVGLIYYVPPPTPATGIVEKDAAMKDVARCGGLGIDDRVGLTLASEKEKHGGALSSQRASDIRVEAITKGLSAGNQQTYQIYVQCILELDKRRSSNADAVERIGQPFLKVQLKRPSSEPNHAEFSVENDGEELSELRVRPIAFLYVGELHLIDPRKPAPRSLPQLHNVYIPVENAFESFEDFPAQYKGLLYRTLTIDERAFDDKVEAFANSDGKNLNTYMLYYAVVDYKDKFGTRHHKVFDTTTEQQELNEKIGQRLIETYDTSIARGVYVDGSRMKSTDLSKIWPSAAKPMSASTPWGTKA